MSIEEVITKHYDEFINMVRNPDLVIEDSRTSEDIFEDVMLLSCKKYKGKDVSEEEAYDYVRSTLLLEWYFAPKRKKKEKIIYTDNIYKYL